MPQTAINSGIPCSSNGTTILVGAGFDDDRGSSSGSAYLFIPSPAIPGGSISAGSGAVTLQAADMSLLAPVTSSATVSLSSEQLNRPINLGKDAAGSLGLTDANWTSSPRARCRSAMTIAGVTVTSNVIRPSATALQIVSGGDITINGGQINTTGGTLLLDAGIAPAAIRPIRSVTDVVSNSVSLVGNAAFVINGPTIDTQYTQFNANSGVNLTGATLVISGSYQPAAADAFTFVNNISASPTVGPFIGLPQGTLMTVNGGSVIKRLTYTGGVNSNDVQLVPWTNAAPVITSNGGGASASITVFDGTSSVTTVTATDADPQTLTYSISGGVDQTRFSVHPTTGVLQFVTPPNYSADRFGRQQRLRHHRPRRRRRRRQRHADGRDYRHEPDADREPKGSRLRPGSQPIARHADHNGQLVKFDAITGAQLASINAGVMLSRADITADGNSLYVAEANYSGNGRLYKVNLSTNGVTTIPYSIGALEAGAWDLAIDANGFAWFDGDFVGSGAVPLRKLDTTTRSSVPAASI